MNKTLTTMQVREIGGQLLSNWDEIKKDVKLSSRSLYNLIALKKCLEEKLSVIEETLMTIANQYGGEPQQDGSVRIPQENQEDAGKALVELGKEEVDIEYQEIVIDEDSSLNAMIMDILFDFICIDD